MNEITIPGMPATAAVEPMARITPSLPRPLDWEALCRAAKHFDLGRKDGRPWVLVLHDYDSQKPGLLWRVNRQTSAPVLDRDISRFADLEEALRFGLAELRAMRPLHVFTTGETWFIAETAEDARDLFCAWQRSEPNLGPADEADETGVHASDWKQLADDSTLVRGGECANAHVPKTDADPDEVEDGEPEAFTCGDPNCNGGERRDTKLCSEWVEEEGQGFLGSSDF